jgi:hypothetical protein
MSAKLLFTIQGSLRPTAEQGVTKIAKDRRLNWIEVLSLKSRKEILKCKDPNVVTGKQCMSHVLL